jgi:uncharacterized protein (DUF302 family)
MAQPDRQSRIGLGLSPSAPGLNPFKRYPSSSGWPAESSGVSPKEALVDETAYGLRVEVSSTYEQAVERTTAALKAEGFGVLTTIDVRQTFKQKLDKDFRKYLILGACNPPLAHKALEVELEIGLVLPCNVIVYESGPGTSVVAAMAPLSAMSVVGNPGLTPVAQEADQRLRRALRTLEGH